MFEENENKTEEELAQEAEAKQLAEQKTNETIEALQTKISELEKDINPNWRELREAHEKLKSELKSRGAEIDANGNIIQPQQKQITEQEITDKINEQVQKGLVNSQVNKSVSSLPQDQQAVVKAYFNKLTAGEKVDVDNVDGFIAAAFRSAGISERQVYNISGGKPPRMANQNSNVDSSKVEALADVMGIKKDQLASDDEVAEFRTKNNN